MKSFLPLSIITFIFAISSSLPVRAQEIVLGQYASLTGSEATFGINSSNGVALALDEVNKEGVLGGRKIKIITEDDQSKPGQPSAAVKKLISSDRVNAVIGEIASSRSLEAAPICQEAKVP
ncbi:MAG: ABC transporter substrate-binding protein, partial [Chthoniobacterales bacterium]|nr:ABC transporter substrate-binding protein [Chthoniobacterales bacterium]